MAVKNIGKGKGKGMENQQNFDFHFHLAINPADILRVEGGSQDELSNFEFKFRQKLKEILEVVGKREVSPMDRQEIASRMSRSLGRDITKTHIDQWTAMSAVSRRMQVDAMKAFCEVIGDFTIMHFFVESCGFKALTPMEAQCAEFGMNTALKSLIDGKLKDIKSGLDNPELIQVLMSRVLQGKV